MEDTMLDKNETILITGSGGVIGRALVEELNSRDYSRVVALASSDGDLRNQNKTNEIFSEIKPKVVFHLAARGSGIMGNMKNRAAAYVDNIRINTNVIESAHLAGARKIVAMGTAAVYSDLCTLPISEDDIWLGPPHSSEAPYGHAKRAMLAQLEAFKEQYGLDYAYCISTNLFGPHDKFDENFGHVLPSLISKFYRAVKDGSEVTIWGDGSPQRDFLYSRDAASAMVLIADHVSGSVNLATGQYVRIRDVVDILARISGYKGKINWDVSMPNGQMLREYSVDRLKKAGFVQAYSLEDALFETYSWYSKNFSVARR